MSDIELENKKEECSSNNLKLVQIKTQKNNWKQQLPAELLTLLNINNEKNIKFEIVFFEDNSFKIQIESDFPCASIYSYRFSLDMENDTFSFVFNNSVKNYNNDSLYKDSSEQSLVILEENLFLTSFGLQICKNMRLDVVKYLYNTNIVFRTNIYELNIKSHKLEIEYIRLTTLPFEKKIERFLKPISPELVEQQLLDIEIPSIIDKKFFIKERVDFNVLFKTVIIRFSNKKNKKHYKLDNKPISKKRLEKILLKQFCIDNQLIRSFKEFNHEKYGINLKSSHGVRNNCCSFESLYNDLKILLTTMDF
jgi:hypothetical protein